MMAERSPLYFGESPLPVWSQGARGLCVAFRCFCTAYCSREHFLGQRDGKLLPVCKHFRCCLLSRLSVSLLSCFHCCCRCLTFAGVLFFLDLSSYSPLTAMCLCTCPGCSLSWRILAGGTAGQVAVGAVCLRGHHHQTLPEQPPSLGCAWG